MTYQRLPPIGLLMLLLVAWSSSSASRPTGATDLRELFDRAAAANERGDHEATIAALEAALEQARLEAPLTVEPFLLVTQAAKFYGDYTPRADAVFRGGEAQQFYLEPKNLVYPLTAAGTYEPAFEVDLKILTADGQVVVSQEEFGSFRMPTKSQVRDIFLNLKVSLSGAPPGEYSVRFDVRDSNSKKTATVTQPITLK